MHTCTIYRTSTAIYPFIFNAHFFLNSGLWDHNIDIFYKYHDVLKVGGNIMLAGLEKATFQKGKLKGESSRWVEVAEYDLCSSSAAACMCHRG